LHSETGLDDEKAKNVVNFVKVCGLSSIVSVSAGLRHAGCVDSGGRVFTWGAGSKGQLGGGEKIKSRGKPVMVSGLSGAKTISCGQYFTLVQTESGICGFGDNKFQQICSGGPQILLNFDILEKLPDSISCGWTHTVCLEGGEVRSWGRNNYYQLGGVEGGGAIMKKVRKAVAGSEHCLCLTDDGEVFSWGWNEHGNCGVGGERVDNVKSPEKVDFGDGGCDIQDIFIGSAHCFAVIGQIS